MSLLYFISYSYTRWILETQSENILKKDKIVRKPKELLPRLRNVSGAASGALVPTSIYLLFSYFDKNQERMPINLLAATTLSYPFIVNSYFQDLGLGGNLVGKEFMSIIANVNNWRGYSLYMFNCILAIIPGLNYLLNETHQIRLAYILGKQNGMNINSYYEAFRHIRENGNFNRGRMMTYLPLTIYNYFAYKRLRHNNKTLLD